MGKIQKLKDQVKDQVKVPNVSRVLKIPQKPDRFAIWIAKAVVFILTPGRYRYLMAPEVLETQSAFLKSVSDPQSWRAKCANEGFRSRLEKLEALFFPGIMTHFVLRKRRIEALVRKEIEKGTRQILSFGPGFDTLLPRLAQEFPEVRCIEADLQSTQKAKMQVLRTRPRNLHFVEVNLQEPYLEKIMSEASPFNKRERTVFIAEGVLMWLDDDDVERMLSFMQDYGALGSRFIFTFLERGVDHKAFAPEIGFLTDAAMKILKINFGWGVRIEHIARFLNDRYFGLVEMETPGDLRRGVDPLPPCHGKPTGDYLAVADLVFIDESPTGSGPKIPMLGD